MNIDILDHLLCPDCKSKIDSATLGCTNCGRVFGLKNGILQFLPSHLNSSDISCDKSYKKWGQRGAVALPLNTLLHRAEAILYFNEQILPKLNLHGNVLEIGSGCCWLSSLIKLKFPATTVAATDVSYISLTRGIQISEFLGARIDCLANCKIENLPFEDQIFDFIIGSAVLHQTNPQYAIKEIFRVLKKNGCYIGVSELAIPKILGSIWSSRLGSQGKAVRASGISYGNYTIGDWKHYFELAGFQDLVFLVDKNPKYKHSQWQNNLYYSIICHLPDSLISRCLAFSLDIQAKK